MLVLCNVHIRPQPLNEQHEQITLLDGGNSDFLPFEWRGRGAHYVPWKCHREHIIELRDEYNNCTKFQFYTEKVVRDIKKFRFISTSTFRISIDQCSFSYFLKGVIAVPE